MIVGVLFGLVWGETALALGGGAGELSNVDEADVDGG